MKTILAPTDFSEVSLNAVMYAAELAKFTKSKLILFNVYSTPAGTIEIPVFIPTIEALQEYSMDGLKKIKSDLQLQFDDKLDIECKCELGLAAESIGTFAKGNKVDMIVMGMQGAGYVQEHILGGTTIAIIRKSHCPVMSINKNQQFKPIKKIALACDYVDMDAETILEPLKELVKIFDADICVLHIIPGYEMASTLKERVKVITALKGIKHSMHGIVENSVVEGLNSFISDHEIDMLVMIPRDHIFIDRLFFESDTKRMAFHSKVPLLALHE